MRQAFLALGLSFALCACPETSTTDAGGNAGPSDSGNAGPSDSGNVDGNTCEQTPTTPQCLCGPQTIASGATLEVTAYVGCACESTTASGCDTVIDGNTITVQALANTCAVGDCALPSCTMFEVTCSIPSLADGTYTVENCNADAECVRQIVVVGNVSDAGTVADAGTNDCSIQARFPGSGFVCR